jgi:integration host factor subunit alpha
MTLTKDRLIEYVKSKSEAPLHQCREVVEIMLEQVKNALEKGEEVKISGFGKWEIKNKKERPGRNPHTGQRIEILSRRVVTFHPSEKMRDAIDHANLSDDKVSIAGSRSLKNQAS